MVRHQMKGSRLIDTDPPLPRRGETLRSDDRLKTWLRVLGILLVIPFGLVAIAFLVGAIADRLPDCHPTEAGSIGSCTIAGIDWGVALVVLAMPWMLFAFMVPLWLALLGAWFALGAVAVGTSLLAGHGFRLHRRWLLQGEDMAIPRTILGCASGAVYALWWLGII
ncbi:hypothetical protein [Aureimonas sp. ME7]|uniref:hypothetical protein n=1 Tax=Aureimonas sp. ME7 TaxID=2744252 RepID=UPI0015F41BC3|nr:hypothetical protein [Aureimonas sp. ME7]